MEISSFYSQKAVGNLSTFQETVKNIVNWPNSPSTCSFPSALSPPNLKTSLPFLSSLSSRSFRLNCYCKDDEHLSTSLAYDVLGLAPDCTAAELKAAFRAKVKEYHPDVRQDNRSSNIMIRRVIKAYEKLSNCSRSEIIERECMDPFDEPECEAFDVFVNEILCVGTGTVFFTSSEMLEIGSIRYLEVNFSERYCVLHPSTLVQTT